MLNKDKAGTWAAFRAHWRDWRDSLTVADTTMEEAFSAGWDAGYEQSEIDSERW